MTVRDRSPRLAGTVAITGGYVVPVAGEPLQGATVLVQDGVITAVGNDVAVPEGTRVIDATGLWVMPGLVDGHAHVGIHEESIGPTGDDTNETSRPVMAGVRVLDGIDIEDVGFKDALTGGITTVGVKPGSGNPIGGQTVVMKTWGGRTVDEQVVSDAVSIKTAFGENPKQVYGDSGATPVTRPGIAFVIRQALEDAQHYVASRDKAAQDGTPFRRDLEMEALGRLLSGELAWDVHVHRHDDIASAIRVAEEFGLRLIVNHGTEGHLLADVLAEKSIPVAVGPIITPRSKPELRGHSFRTSGILANAGVQVAIITDHPELPIHMLVLQVALAVKEGMPRQAGLEAMTVNPAQMLGVHARVGALAPGLDGDVVLWSGDPLDAASRALHVLIEGVTVYEWEPDRGAATSNEPALKGS